MPKTVKNPDGSYTNEEEKLETQEYTLWPDVVDQDKGPYQRVSESGVPYVIPPQPLVANQATRVEFSIRPREIKIQNNTANVIYRSYDPPAGLFSFQIQPGQTLIDTVSTDHIYFYVTVAATINGVAGVVLEAYE